ncbi:MAG TPA: amidase [Bacillota bacterium]|nr:amidase [Bacillota bacterium]
MAGVERETVMRMARELLGQGMDEVRAADAARRLNSLLGWTRALDEERLLPGGPAGGFDPGLPFKPANPDAAWATVVPPLTGTGYGAPPPGAPGKAESDQPPSGVPIPPGITAWPMLELRRALAGGRVTAEEAVEACLSRITDLDAHLRAFITVTADGAREAARRPDQGAAKELDGVPVAVKDVFDTAGVRTTCGSRILAGRIPEADAALVARLRRAGAIIVGKTNTHEFAFGVTTANPHHGTCRNPWNPGRVPGGSSGGSAVAVATGMCYLALGTDTAGSVRIPAACCGIVGFKPTYGLMSTQGIFPLSWSLDHPGTLTRTVTDAATAVTALTGIDHGRRDGEADLGGLVVGLPAGWLDDRVRPEVKAAVQAAIGLLEKQGARVKEVPFPPVHPLLLSNRLIVLAEAGALHRPWLARQADAYGADVRARLELGQLLPAMDYLTGLRLRRELCEAVAATMQDVDLLLTPTLPVPPPRIGESWLEWPDGQEAAPDALIRLTAPFNVTGQPAISIPCRMSGGLPAGVQIIGRWFEDRTVLGAALALESAQRTAGLTIV